MEQKKLCRDCREVNTVTSIMCSKCGCLDFVPWEEPEEDRDDLFDMPDTFELDPTKPQYKIISQKDRFFSGKFDPALIERALNEYAQEGWKLHSAVSADIPGLGGGRNELVVFLEKEPDV